MNARHYGRYEVLGEIGDGAMGRVHLGWDPLVRRNVAIKTLRSDGPLGPPSADAQRRFRREAQAAGGLSHAHIVAIYDVGEDYFVMEYLEGVALQALLRARGRLTPLETVRLLVPIAEALDHAHAAGVIHRDVKPANVMVLPDGRPKLMDFGLARLESAVATAPGDVFGSPSYMAPEQVLGEALTPRADVYALAVVAYECLVGRRPFEAPNVAGLVSKVVHETAPLASALEPALGPACDPVFAQALAKDPEQRPASATGFVSALRRALNLDELAASTAVRADDRLASTVTALMPFENGPRPAGPPAGERRPAEAFGAAPPSAPGPQSWWARLFRRASPPSPPAEGPASDTFTHTVGDLRAAAAQVSPAEQRRPWGIALLAVSLLVVLGVAGLTRDQWRRPAAAAAGPSFVPLEVQAEPAGAQVWLDERSMGRVPVVLPLPAPGRHSVRVALAGFAPAQITLEARPGTPLAPMFFALQPLRATLSVESQPTGAAVEVDGQVLGRTPLSSSALTPGPHVVRVLLDGFQPWQDTLSASVGDVARLHAHLVPRSVATGATKRAAVREGDLVGPGPDVIQPQRIWGEAAAYPPAAKAARMEGQVSVAILVDEEGRPARVTVTESAGPVFDRAVVAAVSAWRFAPARKAGVRVKYVLTWRQAFELAR